MGATLLSLLFDVTLGVLLIACISYCSRLSKRIKMIQDSKGELAGLIGKFDSATERAIQSMAELQTVSKRIADALQLKIDKANFLADDLAFLIEKSTKLAAQLEQHKTPAVTNSYGGAAKKLPESLYSATLNAAATTPSSVRSADTTAAMPDKPVAPSAASHSPAASAKTLASLEAVLQRLSVPPPSPSAPKSAASYANTRTILEPPSPEKTLPRTEAERQLLEALRTRQ